MNLNDKEKQSDKTSAKTSKKETLEECLEKLDKQTLLTIVLEFADKNKHIKEELFLRYSEKTDVLKSARGVIKSAINSVKHYGFVEYRDVGRAVDGAFSVLQMIDDRIDSGDIIISLQLCILVLKEMMNLLQYCDDSNGLVGDTIDEGLEKINKAVSLIAPGHKEDKKIFETVFNHAQDSIYDGWIDFRMALLFSVVPLCSNRANRDKMEKYLLSKQNSETKDWSSQYNNSQFQKLQFEIIKQFNSETSAFDYLEQHLDNNTDFRRIAIQAAISGAQYDRALKLCLEGEQKDVKYPGLLKDWKKFRYAVYEKIEDTQSQKTLALELLLQGSFEYFEKLKVLYTEDEWPAVLQDVLEKSENNNWGNIYVDILIHENLKSRLLEYCKKHIHTIKSYYTHLLPEYINDVGTIFMQYIHDRAKDAGSRSHYRNICELLKDYKKACGNEAMYKLRDELKEKYSKRPTFLDELNEL